MKVLYCGCDFQHEKGEFCARKVAPMYFIGCFSTPFYYETERRLQAGNAGDVLIIPPGTPVYHGPQSKEQSFTNDWLYAQGEDMVNLLQRYPLPQNAAFPIGNTNLLKSCIQTVQEEMRVQKAGYEDMISCALTHTIIQMHRLYEQKHHTDSAVSRVESVREMMLRKLEHHWTLKEMADLSGYSVSRFSALYAQRFGLSPKSDLLRSRVQLAKQMLRYSGQPVTVIAKTCGFQSIYYFSKYFKEAVGLPPSEYAKK